MVNIIIVVCIREWNKERVACFPLMGVTLVTPNYSCDMRGDSRMVIIVGEASIESILLRFGWGCLALHAATHTQNSLNVCVPKSLLYGHTHIYIP